MKKKKYKNIGYYFSLIGLLLLGFLLVYFASPNRELQMLAFTITALFYVSWGILHHKINNELTVRIVVEYVLIGCFGMSIMFFLFKGGLGL